MPFSDIELVQQILAGKHSAMITLVMRYEAPLMRYVKRICLACAPYSEDILQEAFLRCYKNLNDYDPALKFSSWLYRITHNATIDHIRKNRISLKLSEPIVDESIFEGTWLDPELESRKEELQKHIVKILALIPENQRAAFVLRFFEDKEYAEIGDILKENVNTIATWIRRAKELFKTELLKAGFHLEQDLFKEHSHESR